MIDNPDIKVYKFPYKNYKKTETTILNYLYKAALTSLTEHIKHIHGN